MKRAGSIAGLLWRAIFVALLVSSVLTFTALFLIGRAERVKAFDAALLDDFRTIANITQIYPDDDLYVNVEPEALTEFLAGGTRFFQVWDATDAELLDQSPSLEALGHRFEQPQGAVAQPRRVEATLPDGRAVSLLYQRTAANWGMDQAMLSRTGLTIRDRAASSPGHWRRWRWPAPPARCCCRHSPRAFWPRWCRARCGPCVISAARSRPATPTAPKRLLSAARVSCSRSCCA
jgi:Two-component sensor kinase N-terminal